MSEIEHYNDSLAESSLLQAKAMTDIMIAEDRQIKNLMSMLTKPLKKITNEK